MSNQEKKQQPITTIKQGKEKLPVVFFFFKLLNTAPSLSLEANWSVGDKLSAVWKKKINVFSALIYNCTITTMFSEKTNK